MKVCDADLYQKTLWTNFRERKPISKTTLHPTVALRHRKGPQAWKIGGIAQEAKFDDQEAQRKKGRAQGVDLEKIWRLAKCRNKQCGEKFVSRRVREQMID